MNWELRTETRRGTQGYLGAPVKRLAEDRVLRTEREPDAIPVLESSPCSQQAKHINRSFP